MVLSLDQLSDVQNGAITRLFEHDLTLLVAPTGEGKTIICLTAIAELINEGHLNRVIVACPAKVVDVWPTEAQKWYHLKDLKIATVTGDPSIRREIVKGSANVLVTSLNNLDWLLTETHSADGIIIDEVSKGTGKQTSKLKHKKYTERIRWRVGMTATPVAQDFEKIWGMVRIIDGGRALGTSKTKYLNHYFYPDHSGYSYTIRDKWCADEILTKTAHLIHYIEDTKASKLPALTENTIPFQMPAETRALYQEMAKEFVVFLKTKDGETDVEAVNSAVKSGKQRQLASGFLYDEAGHAHEVDRERALQARAWVDSLHGTRGVIFYEFKEQLAQLTKALTSSTTDRYGKEQILLAQIQSMSHGVDGIQDHFHRALFLQPVWSRDAHLQAIGRLWRTGQTKPVTIDTLKCEDTVDELVMARDLDNAAYMKLFVAHMKQQAGER